jgi:hypothetical protein
MTNQNTINAGTFSLFADFDAKTPALRDASYGYIYKTLTSGKLEAKTNALRALAADLVGANAALVASMEAGADEVTVADLKAAVKHIESEQDKLKKSLPFLTISSRYDEAATSKAGAQPLTHSGELCFDFDHLSNEELTRLTAAFRADGKTVLLFTSPRGQGLKRCVTVKGLTLENHKAVYYALMLEHWRAFQAAADRSCVNVNRGTFLPHDADAYYNVMATPYDAGTMLATYPDAENKAKFVAKQFEKGGNPADIPADVVTWVYNANKPAPKVSSSTPTGTSSAMLMVSSKPANEATVARHYSNTENLAALNHIVNECERLNVSLSDCHENNIRIGWALHSVGADVDYFHRITRLNPDYDRDKMQTRFTDLERLHNGEKCGFGFLVNLAKEAGITANKPQKLTVSGTNNKVTQMDIRDAVKQLYDVYFDEGSGQYYYATPGNLNPFEFTPFTEKSTFLNELLGDLEGVNLFISKGKLAETLFNKMTYKGIDYLPLQMDWLAAHYDGKDHLSKLISSLTTEDNTLFDAQFRKWIVNVVAQVYDTNPSARNDAAFILVGAQGLGKTGFFEFLLWSPKWFVTKSDFNFNNKEHQLLMNSKVMILLDEMSSYNKADIKDLKGVFSKTVINADKKYQEAADYKRNASFAGCSNNSDFLRDDTGDRRFLVFQMFDYDRAVYNAVDKAQLWGQLVTMYKGGFDYKFDREEIEQTIARNLSQYTVHKPEDTFIHDCLVVTGNAADYLSNGDLEKLLNEYKHDNHVRDFMTISTIRAKLKLMGATVGQQKKVAGKVVKGYSGVRVVGYDNTPTVTPTVTSSAVTNPAHDAAFDAFFGIVPSS